jgi:hypothetical protein
VDTRAISFSVTPNHRMVVNPQKSSKPVFRLAKDLYRQDTIPVVTKGLKESDSDPLVEIYPGKWCNESDWAEFLGWYVSEGCTTGNSGGRIQKSGRGHQVMISQCSHNNLSKCERIESLFLRMGLNFRKRGGTYFLTRKALWEVLYPLGNCYTKRLPTQVFSFNRNSLELLFEAMIDGDGWRKSNGLGAYASVSKGLIDDLQMVMQLIGKPHGSIVVRDRDSMQGDISATSDQYWLIERVNSASCITNKAKEFLPTQPPYKGKVYCVSVPNQTLVVRRNGNVMICGNCLRYACVAAIEHYPESAFATVGARGGGGY